MQEKKAMRANDKNIKTESLINIFENPRRASVKANRKKAKNIMKNPGKALEIGEKMALQH